MGGIIKEQGYVWNNKRLMEQHSFCIFINYRGHYRKGVATYNATLVNLQPKPWFHCTKNVLLNTTELQNVQNL